MEETFPRGNRITPSSPWLLLSLTPATPTHTPAHTHARTHTHTHMHSDSHVLSAAPKPIPGAPHCLLFGVCVGLPEFSQGPASRQQRGHHGLFRSLSVLSFSGSFRPPTPPHCLLHPAPAFSTPLGMKFGGFFCIFEVFCSLSPALPCPPSPSVLTWKERMHLCLL